MGIITIKEVRRRSRLDLVSDKNLPFSNPVYGLGKVREGQQRMERRYGRHDAVRKCATNYFLSKGYDVCPRGITINGVETCPDFAFFRGKRLIFVECLTEGWVNQENTKKKRLVEKFAPIIFVVEEPSVVKFEKSPEKGYYVRRIQRLATKCKVFLCNPTSGIIKPFVYN